MKSKFQTNVLKAVHSIKKKKNSLKNNTLYGLLLGLASVSIMFLMTGVVYYRNEVRINDEGVLTRTFTMYDSLDEILKEQNIVIGQFDRVDFGGISDGEGDIFIHRSLTVPVTADGKTVMVECAYNETAAEVIVRSGFTMEEQDVSEPYFDTPCADIKEVQIHRGYPVYVEADGKTIETSAYFQTAETVLKRAGVTLGGDDYINYDMDRVIEEGETVVVTRVYYEEMETYEVVPYNTITEKSNLVSMANKEITQEGSNGTRTNTSIVKYVNGKRVSETPVGSEVTKEPVVEVVSTGAALATPYSKKNPDYLVLDNGIPLHYEKVLTGKSCAYTARMGSGTASGRKLEIGTVAVDPNVIPYGSELYITSTDGRYVYGYAVAADTGDLTAHGVLVDLYMGNMEDYYDVSVAYGAKQVNIYIIGHNG
ncbi:MAG: ubiquitin-like domain-containing protein [Firmicutes bacterium]|nr:ubiquitin-like domain-containing protein [[Eubacterium] siraeum]MCM1487265.1 ubiquitin-like domain-containing protein [Bacillota bacterium]